jgi:hypothetical protein
MKYIFITLIILYKSTFGLAQKEIIPSTTTLGERKLSAVLEVKQLSPTTIIKICSPSRHSLANPPLFILDGMEITRADSLNIKPENIESISVLKDKTAIEPYGKKGENRVIIITSKEK